MIKNFTRIEHKIKDKEFHFLCNAEATITECIDAASAFMKAILARHAEAQALEEKNKAIAAAQNAAEEAKTEPVGETDADEPKQP